MDLIGFSLSQIITFLLVFARVAGIFTTAPIFANVHVAPTVRVAIALSFAFIFFPMVPPLGGSPELLPFLVLIIKETIVGVIMGFLASLMFTAIQMAGAFIDLQAGFGFAQIVDPMSKESNAVIGQFQNMVATLLFLAINGHHLMIRGLADSFQILPLGQMGLSPETAGGIFNLFAMVFLAALKIGTPIVGAIFLTDVGLGVLSRAVPQLNVFVVGMPAKVAMAFAALLVTLPMAFGVMTGLLSGIHRDLVVLLKQLAF